MQLLLFFAVPSLIAILPANERPFRLAKESAVSKYSRLKASERERFIKALIQIKDFESVIAIAHAFRLGDGPMFGFEIVRQCDGKSVIALMRKMPRNTWLFQGGLEALQFHRHGDVIDFVREQCTYGNPYIREKCYLLCIQAKWCDLIDLAYRDLDNHTPLFRVNGDGDKAAPSIGDIGKRYFDWAMKSIATSMVRCLIQ